MGKKVMVNNIPMSVVYSGMSIDRYRKLAALYDKAADIVSDRAYDNGTSIFDMSLDEWDYQVGTEFSKLCARAAKKAEWNNKPNNKINKIIRVRKQKVSSK